MESTIQLKSKRGPYKPRVKAKIDSHLLLKEEDRAKLVDLLRNNEIGVVEIQWNISNEEGTRQRDRFLHENGLDIDPDDVRCRWSTRYSSPTTIVTQCIGIG